MSRSHTSLWTLDELSAQVALALAVDYEGQASGRVREVPDIRTIRYYTTLGLLDRPAQMRGRTALYGERHLLQLVAIKRLQAKGLSLAEVQTQVAGQSDAVLRRLSHMPAHHAEAERTRTEETADERRRTAFWGQTPVSPPSETKAEQIDKSGHAALPLVGVPLGDGVTLLVQSRRAIDEFDMEALRSAAAPLLKLLKTRRISDAERENAGGQPKGDAS